MNKEDYLDFIERLNSLHRTFSQMNDNLGYLAIIAGITLMLYVRINWDQLW